MTSSSSVSTPRPASPPWAVLAVTSLAVFAVFLDTTPLTIDEAIARAVAEVEARMDD